MTRHAFIFLVLIFLVICDVIPSASSTNFFRTSPRRTPCYVGDDVTMEWTLSSDPERFSNTSVFNENDVRIFLRVHGGLDTIDPGYAGRVSFYNTSSGGVGFRLTDVTLSDAGIYMCRHQPTTKPSIVSSPSVLFIYGEPSTPVISLKRYGQISEPFTGDLVEGGRVSLLCEANSTSIPATERNVMKYVWSRNGLPIARNNPPDRHSVLNATGRRLDISPISRDDVKYYCVGREYQSALHSLATRILNVLYPPSTISVHTPRPSLVVQGSSLTVKCTVPDPGNPPAHMEYMSPQGQIFTSSNIILVISNVSLERHDGRWWCYGKNSVDTGNKATFDVTVHVRPRVVQNLPATKTINITQTLSVSCSFEGRTQPAIQWTYGGSAVLPDAVETVPGSANTINKLVSSSSSLRWKTVSDAQRRLADGVYRCTATNAAGNVTSREMTLFTQYPPGAATVTVPPPLLVVQDASLTVTCSLSDPGNPPARVVYRSPKEKFPTTTNNSLVIRDVRLERDDGTWACYGENSAGSGNPSTFDVTVYAFVSEPLLTRRYVGDDVTMEWTLSSDPERFSNTSFFNENDVRIILRTHGGLDTIGAGYEGRVSFYSTSSRGVGFRLTDVTLSDAGRYRFRNQPTTEPSIVSSSSVLFIFGEPSTPAISLKRYGQISEPFTGDLEEGDSVTLLCEANSTSLPAADRPAMTYTWSRNGEPIDRDNPPDRHLVSSDTGRRLDISPVSRDDVTYDCTAREEESTLYPQTTRNLNLLWNNSATIAAVTVTAIVVIIVIVVVIVLIVLRRKRRISKTDATPLHENPAYQNYRSATETGAATEFEESQVEVQNLLSDGTGFQLYSAQVQIGLSQHAAIIKRVKDVASQEVYRRYLADQMSVLLSLKHVNIVKLLGFQRDSAGEYENEASMMLSVSLVLGPATQGDLHTFLTGHGAGVYQKTATMETMMGMALGVATGALALSEVKPAVLHHYICAKHVLVDDRGVCKLTGFSTAEAVRAREAWEAIHKLERPIRWMSAETLDHLEHTSKSDVWSFAIFLWELFSLGEIPYPGLEDDEVQTAIQDRHRLEKPNNCDPIIYDLMVECWIRKPERRPGFEYVVKSLMNSETTHASAIISDEHTYEAVV